MEEKTKFLQLIRDREEAEGFISKYSKQKEDAEKKIKESINFFSKLRPLIAKSVLENMDKDYFEMVMQEREYKRIGVTNTESAWGTTEGEYGSTAYYISNIFDPEHDDFGIYSFVYNEDKTKVRFNVECYKLREYLGISGAWIPKIFPSCWIDINDLRKAEE